MAEIQVDLERQKEAKRYARIKRRLFLVDLVIAGSYALAWLIFGWSKSIKASLLTNTTNEWLLVITYIAVFGGIYYLINLPLSFYSSYILPHRFGLSNQKITGWISDQLKGGLLGLIIGGVLLEIIYAVLRIEPDRWWIWAGVILVGFNVILANLGPVLLFPIFNKFIPLENENEELANRLIRLADRADIHVQGVFKFDMSRRTKAANAGLAGLGNTRRIILGDTLLDEFTDDEIETIFAHELGHHVHKDIPMSIIIESGLTLVGLFLASLGLSWGTELLGFNGVADIAGFPILMLIFGIFGMVTMPLSNGYSRWRERRADEYALLMTENGKVYADALTRLANLNLAETDPETWVELLLYSHPALGKRISMARKFDQALSR